MVVSPGKCPRFHRKQRKLAPLGVPETPSGTQGALCLEHGAPSCPRCRSRGWGISRCCRAGHEGYDGSAAGLRCPVAPLRVAPGPQVLVPQDRRTGAAWLCWARPASQALPVSGPHAARRCTAPPRTLGAASLGPGDLISPKRPKPDLPADQGRAVSVGPTQPEGGTPICPPPHQPPETTPDRRQRAPILMLTRLGHYLRRGAPPPPTPFPPQSNPHRRRPNVRRCSPMFFTASRRP